ncbi:MAG: peptidyl-prolyl cis-trans isomerase [Actinomycetota bacterium]
MSINLKKILIPALAGIFVLGVVGCGLFVKVAATVDGEKITVEQLDKAVKPLTMEQGESASREVEEKQRMQVLESLIQNAIYRREAQAMGIKVTDREVEAEINTIKKRFRSEADFRSSFEVLGWTLNDLRDYVKIRLIRSAVDNRIVKKVKVSEKEMRDYYGSNKDGFRPKPEQVKIGFIQLKTQQEAQDVLAKIRGGMDFDEAMLKFSIDSTIKTKGIRKEFVQRGEFTRLSPRVGELAFSLPVEEVTEPIQTPVGWLLMKVYERKAATKGTYEEVKGDIEKRLKIQKWITEARKKVRIKIYL